MASTTIEVGDDCSRECCPVNCEDCGDCSRCDEEADDSEGGGLASDEIEDFGPEAYWGHGDGDY